MTKKQSTKQRTQVKDLPKKEKKLTEKEMKKVKGSFSGGGSQTATFGIKPIEKKQIMMDDDLLV